MNTEFAFLSLSRAQLVELQRALLSRHIVEEVMRREQGLEPAEYPALLTRIEHMLGLSSEETHQLYHRVEDEVWEHSWFNFTDEWAWYRAKKEVEHELGKRTKQTHPDELENLIERRYHDKFERYVGEVDMHDEEEGGNKKPVRQPKKQ